MKNLLIHVILQIFTVFFLNSPSACKNNCDNFDFNKNFKSLYGGDILGVNYDIKMKQLTNQDGLYFSIILPSKKIEHFYNKDGKFSTKERLFIDKYSRNEMYIDKKYAKFIKNYITEQGKIQFSRTVYGKKAKELKKNDIKNFSYPSYIKMKLNGITIDEPPILLSNLFMITYISSRNNKNSFKNKILSIIDNYTIANNELSSLIDSTASVMIKNRLDSISSEYILSYYLTKYRNNKLEINSYIEIKSYIADTVFRATAESLYKFSNRISNQQKCKISNYAREKSHELIDKIFTKDTYDILKNYQEDIKYICASKISSEGPTKKYYNGEISKQTYKKLEKELFYNVINNKILCENE